MEIGKTSNASSNTTALLDCYQKRLGTIPSPGGNGCHVALLGAANLGVKAGVPTEQIFSDLREAIPAGRRTVTNREIADAVNRAARDHEAGGTLFHAPKPEPVIDDGTAILRKLIDQGKGASETDLWEASPVRIDWPPEEDTVHILETMCSPDNLVFIGERHEDGIMGQTIRTAGEWVSFFGAGGKTAPHIIPNPLNGQLAEKKGGGGYTLRGDGNVSTFRFCIVEFDDLNRDNQLSFWFSVDLPISALIDSGGKSIHGWIDVRQLADVQTIEAWDHHIKNRLYFQVLTPLGVDSACSNPSRLSRLPGHLRAGTERRQQVLYLSPKGRRVR